jgi:hypothetical protein
MYRTVAVVFLNLVVILVLMEAASALSLRLLPSEFLLINGTHKSPYISGKSWADEYWREFNVATSRAAYYPYALWRFPEFRGRYINISVEGLRETPGTDCSLGAAHVWMFGGSAMWGITPDDGTIPAHLQRLMPRTCVVNFGQLGHVSTQGVIQLEQELRSGRRPALVIFYDGVNDIMTTLMYQRPGWHIGFQEVAERLEARAFKSIVATSSLFQVVKRLGGLHVPQSATASSDPVDLTVATYLANVQIVKALANAYGFHAVFFWQPNVFVGTKPRTTAEQALVADPHLSTFIQRVHERLRQRAVEIPDFHDLTDVFAGEASLAYLDWCHTTPEANQKIAQVIRGAVRK